MFENASAERTRASQAPAMVRFVVEHSGGLVRTQQQANYILIGLAIAAFAATAVLIFGPAEKPTVVPSPVGDNPLPLQE